MLKDKYGRNITYLRVSITDRCNLRCIYCGGELHKLDHTEILTYEEILKVISIFVGLGIRKVRITGGEPFLRKGIDFFIEKVSEIKGIEEVAITTNAILLEEHLDTLKRSRIRKINISLDSLSPEKYKKITGYDGFHKVWEAICKAEKMGFLVKINTVVLKGINEDEAIDFAKLSLEKPFHVRFIEYMDVGRGDFFVSNQKIKETISKIGELIPTSDESSIYPGPAVYFKFKGAKGKIGFISPVSSHFCKRCNRIRLTADGHIRPCLLHHYEVDIKNPIRKGASEEKLKKIILSAVYNKPIPEKNFIEKPMCLIGG